MTASWGPRGRGDRAGRAPRRVLERRLRRAGEGGGRRRWRGKGHRLPPCRGGRARGTGSPGAGFVAYVSEEPGGSGRFWPSHSGHAAPGRAAGRPFVWSAWGAARQPQQGRDGRRGHEAWPRASIPGGAGRGVFEGALHPCGVGGKPLARGLGVRRHGKRGPWPVQPLAGGGGGAGGVARGILWGPVGAVCGRVRLVSLVLSFWGGSLLGAASAGPAARSPGAGHRCAGFNCFLLGPGIFMRVEIAGLFMRGSIWARSHINHRGWY